MIRCKRHGTEHAPFEPCPQCIEEIRATPPEVLDATLPSPTGFRNSPPSNPGGQLAERSIEAIKRAFAEEFGDDDEMPRVTLVVSLPPDGEIVVASTENEPRYVLNALEMGRASAHRTIRLAPRNN
jgi:hypothetical protein